MRMYEDEMWCDHCQAWTRQQVADSEHERDSSGDSQECLRCGWTYSGLTGRWEPPHGSARPQ